jgi:two-component system, sensor histidine kinase and response regulator
MSEKELQQQKAEFSLQVKKRSDKLINYFLTGYFVMGLIFAFFYDTWLIAFGIGSICLLAYYSVKTALPSSNLYQYVLSVIFGVFMAQYIYQMHGMFEMHFFAFIGSAILITYQNWKLQIPMLLVVVIHHIAFSYLQNTGVESVYFTQLDYFEWKQLIVHFVLAAIIFFICGLWGYQLRMYSEKQIEQSMEMTKLEKEATYAQELAALEEKRHAADLETAVAQGKFEIASGVMHDIGNAVVGFGSHMSRIKRASEQNNGENIQRLSEFFVSNKEAMTASLGNDKSEAIIKVLRGIMQTEKSNLEAVSISLVEQKHIINHIQEILQIQRQYVAGRESQERKPVNLKDVVHDCLSMLSASADKLKIRVAADISMNSPVIKGDRTKLMQVVLNILKNSMESIDYYAPEKAIDLTIRAANEQLILQIKDTGKGFDEMTADKLFARGFTTKSTGSGLGLYNCKMIIESHQGTIQMSSDGPGKGAMTTICFAA